MTIHFLPTDDDRLAELDHMIRSLKAAGVQPERIAVYSSLASEVRARRPGIAADALRELSRRMDDLVKTKTALGYNSGALCGIAQELIGRWAVVKLALELFEEGHRETLRTVLDLINPLHGSLDLQTYDERHRENFDGADSEFAVNVTNQQERDLTQAVLILEGRLKP